MSSINHSSSVDVLTTSAMVAFVTPDHDEGLCHDNRWARDLTLDLTRDWAAERRAYPRVADAALVRTPSCTTHDDIHYAN